MVLKARDFLFIRPSCSTPLAAAANVGNLAIVNYLLEKGAAVDATYHVRPLSHTTSYKFTLSSLMSYVTLQI